MASDHFERVDTKFGAGTSKLASRSDVQRLGSDAAALSAGDFLGRLISLFGPPDGDGFVLRHLPTGLIITAYAAQSGPAYGGGPRIRGELPAEPPALSLDERLAAQRAASEHEAELGPIKSAMFPAHLRIIAGLRRGEDVSSAQDELRASWLRCARHECPQGFAEAIDELEAILEQTAIADFETIDDSSDFGPQRHGARDGAPFSEPLSLDETIAFYQGQLRELPEDAHFLALMIGLKLFFVFGEAKRKPKRWLAPLREVWSLLLDRAEALGAEEPARGLRELLEKHAAALGIEERSRARLRSLDADKPL